MLYCLLTIILANFVSLYKIVSIKNSDEPDQTPQNGCLKKSLSILKKTNGVQRLSWIEGLQVQDSSPAESLCCVLAKDTLSAA